MKVIYNARGEMTVIVQYNIATYEGTIEVSCNSDDDDEYIIGQAKRILRNKVGSFPFGYQCWKIIERYGI